MLLLTVTFLTLWPSFFLQNTLCREWDVNSEFSGWHFGDTSSVLFVLSIVTYLLSTVKQSPKNRIQAASLPILTNVHSHKLCPFILYKLTRWCLAQYNFLCSWCGDLAFVLAVLSVTTPAGLLKSAHLGFNDCELMRREADFNNALYYRPQMTLSWFSIYRVSMKVWEGMVLDVRKHAYSPLVSHTVLKV